VYFGDIFITQINCNQFCSNLAINLAHTCDIVRTVLSNTANLESLKIGKISIC